MIRSVIVAGVFALICSFVISGRYTIVGVGQGYAYVLDRFTGDVRVCAPRVQCAAE